MLCDESSGQICDEDNGGISVGDDGGISVGDNTGAIDDGSRNTGVSTGENTNTSISVSDMNNTINTASSNIMGNFIDLLPAIVIIICTLFGIKFVSYWLKKYKKGK